MSVDGQVLQEVESIEVRHLTAPSGEPAEIGLFGGGILQNATIEDSKRAL